MYSSEDTALALSLSYGSRWEASQALRVALEAVAHLVTDVEFHGFTPAGGLRQAAFNGWDDDGGQAARCLARFEERDGR